MLNDEVEEQMFIKDQKCRSLSQRRGRRRVRPNPDQNTGNYTGRYHKNFLRFCVK
jgi:hypothetical protein